VAATSGFTDLKTFPMGGFGRELNESIVRKEQDERRHAEKGGKRAMMPRKTKRKFSDPDGEHLLKAKKAEEKANGAATKLPNQGEKEVNQAELFFPQKARKGTE